MRPAGILKGKQEHNFVSGSLRLVLSWKSKLPEARTLHNCFVKIWGALYFNFIDSVMDGFALPVPSGVGVGKISKYIYFSFGEFYLHSSTMTPDVNVFIGPITSDFVIIIHHHCSPQIISI